MSGTTSLRARSLFLIGAMLAASVACAQEFPNRTIRILTGSPGSNIANAARIVSQGIAPTLGQPVILEHRGGGAAVHAELIAKAPADGYTLLLTGGSFWIGPLFQDKAPYDPVKGYAHISLVARAPGLLVVHPSLPVKSISELIAFAKARPGQLHYGTGGDGGIGHLGGELFNAIAGVKLVRVRYSNDAVQTSELLNGLVEMTFAGTNVMQHVKAGKLRALGVTSDQPSPVFPGVPPIDASLRGYSVFATNALVAAGGTPAAAVQRINQAVVRYLELPAARELFLAAGLEAVFSTPEQLTALMKAEMETAGKVIRSMDIRRN